MSIDLEKATKAELIAHIAELEAKAKAPEPAPRAGQLLVEVSGRQDILWQAGDVSHRFRAGRHPIDPAKWEAITNHKDEGVRVSIKALQDQGRIRVLQGV